MNSETMKSHIANEIQTVLGKKEIRPFKPLAYYDKHMDCIRVELRDCSFSEERLNALVTILEDNYPGHRNATAGIMFKGIKHFFSEVGLPLEGIIYVTTIIDQMVKKYPDLAQERICKLVNDLDLTVDMSESDRQIAA